MTYKAEKGLKMREELIFRHSVSGKKGYSLPCEDLDDVEKSLPDEYSRKSLSLPELSEPEVFRHYTRLSTLNFSIDHNFYPLGSCTMKYNPKINEQVARLPEFAAVHPETPLEEVQGTLRIMYDMQEMLAEIGGFADVTLAPAAGAHGEYVGLSIIRKYFDMKGESSRDKMIIPDSAHGTNPASCTLNGFEAVILPSDNRGQIDPNELRKIVDNRTAGIMLTNPNTLGVFETDILEITEIIHNAGGLVYGDGANMNALLGVARPGAMGIDVLHYNLHKTFSTPHGGGGPGSGPVAVCEELTPYLPEPHVRKDNGFYNFYRPEKTIGKIGTFHGNVGVVIKACAYILELGREHISDVAKDAVLSANYMKSCLKDVFNIRYPENTMHEAVFDDSKLPGGVSTMDLAKALLDRGFHAPTVYFPLIVEGAIMIEPTETESRETMDAFIEAMKDIAKKAETDPESIKSAPVNTVFSRPDETEAARNPILTFKNIS
ncbi:MAG: aminomethyl-transferring glycine dehydrogenase subunit GcvPB [bacterium]